MQNQSILGQGLLFEVSQLKSMEIVTLNCSQKCIQPEIKKDQKSRGPSEAGLLGSSPSGLLDFVLYALQSLRPCDPRNGAMNGQCVRENQKKSQKNPKTIAKKSKKSKISPKKAAGGIGYSCSWMGQIYTHIFASLSPPLSAPPPLKHFLFGHYMSR